jgi:hypothetical protein
MLATAAVQPQQVCRVCLAGRRQHENSPSFLAAMHRFWLDSLSRFVQWLFWLACYNEQQPTSAVLEHAQLVCTPLASACRTDRSFSTSEHTVCSRPRARFARHTHQTGSQHTMAPGSPVPGSPPNPSKPDTVCHQTDRQAGTQHPCRTSNRRMKYAATASHPRASQYFAAGFIHGMQARPPPPDECRCASSCRKLASAVARSFTWISTCAHE